MPDIRPFRRSTLAAAWLIVIIFCTCVGRLEAQTTEIASDNFNEPNGPLGTNWAYPIATETTFVITNGQVTPAQPDYHTEAFWTSNSFSNNQYAQVRLPTIGPWTGVVLRADTNYDEFYLGFVFGPNDYRIYARYGYTNMYPYFSLATGSAVTWHVGDIMKLEISGSNDPVTVTMYQNGTPVLVWRSTTNTDPLPVKNGGNPGIGIYSPAGDNLSLDNWQGGNLNPDTTPPSVPTNLMATVASPSEIALSWASSTDNVGVVGYVVDRSAGVGSTNFIQIGTPTGTNFDDVTATPGTTNNYLVMALDAAGNLSGSSEVTATTPIPPVPTVSVIPNQTTLTGIAVGPFPFNISDGTINPSTLSVTVASSNTSLVPDQNLSIFNLGSIQALTIVPASGQTGTSIITITVGNGVNSTNTSFLLTVNPSGNGTDLFANGSNIVISSLSPAVPYPSSISVSGDGGVISNLEVTFYGMSDSDPGDLNALLVGPSGQAVVLMSDAIGNNPMNDLTFTLSDQAYYPLPESSSLLNGTFQPTDYAPNHTNPLYAFPSPAPVPPYAPDLSSFDGLSPNGTWSLYLYDGGNGDSGQIAGGWSLAITTVSPPTIGGLTNQSTPVNTPTAAIPFEIADAQTPASNLVLTATSSNPALVNPATDIEFGGSGSNSTITITPEPNTIGTSTVSVIVTDSDGMSATNSFLMTVNQGQLTVTGITAVNKQYDGTTLATLNAGAANLTGQGLNGSGVTLNTSGASGMFTDQNVGTNKAVQIANLTLNGSNAGNYILTQPATTANITSAGVTISSGLAANSKVYDGTAVATISSNAVVLSGVVASDVGNVSLSTNGYVASFASTNAGNNIAVSVSGLTLTGSAAGNYSLSAPVGLSANITSAGVTISAGLTANSKIYDGTAVATISSNAVVLSGVLAGDVGNVSLSTNGYVASFASTNVGNNIAVSVSGLTLTGSAAGNYSLSAPGGLAANITGKTVTISSGLTANSKVYDGTAVATISSNAVVLSGVVASDVGNVSLSTNGYVASFASTNVGNNIAVSVSGLTLTGSAAGNYSLSAPGGLAANITGKTVTISSGLAANSKVYDGTAVATISSNTVVLSGVVASDVGNVSLSTNGYVAAFASTNVGNNITVNVTGLTLAGSAAGNYSLSAPAGLSANITGKTVTISSGLTANSKVYDGTAVATISSNAVVLNGVVASDVGNVSLSTNGYVASFASTNVGNNIAVSVSGLTLTGSAAGNYSLSAPGGLSANITGKTVTISSGLTANSKVYDGTAVATISSNAVVLSGVVASDVGNVSLSTNGYVASFASTNVGNNIAVSVSGLTLTGSAAGNYSLSAPGGLAANITGKTVTISSGLAANSKVYDGTAVATISSNTVVLSGVVASDAGNVSLSTNGYAASFASTNVGNNITVSVSGLTLTGSAAGNYSLSAPGGLSANITGKTVTISSGLAANSKVYDGTAVATISSNAVVLNGVVASDVGNVSLSTNGYVAAFASTNVGNNIVVSVSGLTLTGSAAGNYSLSAPGGLSANITGKTVTISSGLTANSKVYDGTAVATISSNAVVLNGVVASDVGNVSLSTNGYVASFASTNVGNNIVVSVSGLTLTGSAAGNYSLSAPVGLNANITGKTVTISSGLAANPKVYDGTAVATISSNTVVLSGLVISDVGNVSLSTNGYVAAFASTNVGNNIVVSVSGLTLTGSAAGNYSLSAPNGLSANITSAGVTIAGGLTANSKVYDGTVVATISSNTVVLSGVVASDAGNVSLSTNGYVAAFASTNAGNNIAVSVSGLTLTGSAAGNYSLSAPGGLAANITPVTLTVSAVNNSRVYGLPNPPLAVSYSGFVNGEGTNVLSGAPNLSTGATMSSPPGAYAITVVDGTLSATNYSFNFVNGTLTVVALPQLSIAALSSSQLVFNWPTIASQTYQLETSTNLIVGAWTPVGAAVAGTGNPVIVTNSLGTSLPQFFKLSITP